MSAWHIGTGRMLDGTAYHGNTTVFVSDQAGHSISIKEAERRLNAFDALVGVLEKTLPLVNPDFAARSDEAADAFYREMGIVAPFRSVPPVAAAEGVSDAERYNRWEEWNHFRIATAFNDIRAALRLARGEAEVRA